MLKMSENNNRLIIIAVAVIAVAGLLYVGISSRQTPSASTETQVVASFYPIAYMAEQIGGDKISVSTIITPGSDVHSWDPSISDIASAEDADLIIYLGAGLDHWMEEDIIETIDTSGKTVLEASEGIELIEIHEEHDEHDDHDEHHEEEEGHEEEEDDHDDHDHEGGDPHLWISPRTALILAENIADSLIEADPANQEIYTENWSEFKTKLETLDNSYTSTLAPASGESFFVTHSAYGYIAVNYGMEQHGLIGVSADEQPSTAQVVEIVEEMIEEESYIIYIDPVYSEDYAQTLKAELESRTGEEVQILLLYLMTGPVDNLDYLEQLEENLDHLEQGMIN